MALLSWARAGVASPTFDPGHAFVSSPLLSPSALAAARLLLALYALCTLCTALALDTAAGSGASFFSYFTQLSYIGLAAYLVAAGVQTAGYARWGRTGYWLRGWGRGLQAAHVLLQSTVVVFPFIVTVVFWALLSSPDTFSTTFSAWSNTSLHALNSAFALLELLLTNAPPAPLLALPVQILLLVGYLGVAYITKASQGFYPYPFLNPATQHARLAAYIIGIAVGDVVVFFLTRSVVLLRIRIFASRNKEGREEGLTGGDGGGREGLEDWEEVERPVNGVVPAKREGREEVEGELEP
ncbi:hypothetical protein FB451DRAFT_1231598 [Mycena latifolia]|nr:hypothetical protein FB451DRAFT_1231598 [Mycena latifolia]